MEYFVFQLRGIAAALGLVENQKNLIGFDIKRPSEISDGLLFFKLFSPDSTRQKCKRLVRRPNLPMRQSVFAS